MGLFSQSSSKHRRSHGGSNHSSGHHQSSSRRHGGSSRHGRVPSPHGGSGSKESKEGKDGSTRSSSGHSSRTSGSRKRSHHEPSTSPSTASATADEEGSVTGATVQTEATEYDEEEYRYTGSQSGVYYDNAGGRRCYTSEYPYYDHDGGSGDGNDEDDGEDGIVLEGQNEDNGYEGSSSSGSDDGRDDDDDEEVEDHEGDVGSRGSGSSMQRRVRAHVYENGLRYHAFQGGGGSVYALPNDEVEQNRDDMKHAVTMLLMKGQLFYAPVHQKLKAGGEVYDLGTGTGIWAIEIADKYPKSTVHGVDLSPIQPNYVPRNVFFAIDDFEDAWDSPLAVFDYIHMRHSLWSVADRPALLRRIFHHLKPGGFVEFQELVPDLQLETSSSSSAAVAAAPNAIRDFIHYVSLGLQQSSILSGGDLFAADPARLAAELAAAGFNGIHATTHKAPLGDWSASSSSSSSSKHRHLRRSGALLQRAMLDGLRGWAARPLGRTAGGLGWTPTQIEIFLVDVRKAISHPVGRPSFPLHVVYAQKPE